MARGCDSRSDDVVVAAEDLARDLAAAVVLDATVSFPKPRFDGDYRPESGRSTWLERTYRAPSTSICSASSARRTVRYTSRDRNPNTSPLSLPASV